MGRIVRAKSVHSDAIVTHNVRDFVGASRFRPRVLTPAEFLAQLEEPS